MVTRLGYSILNVVVCRLCTTS